MQQGDSLWSIAGTYGDPTQWPAIYEENRGEATPGGGTFTNPNVIHPGQELDIPAPLAEQSPAAEKNDGQEELAPSAPDADEATDQETGKTPGNDDAKTPDKHQDDQAETATPAPGPALPTSPSPAPTTTQPQQDNAGERADQRPTSDEQTLAPAAVWAGAARSRPRSSAPSPPAGSCSNAAAAQAAASPCPRAARQRPNKACAQPSTPPASTSSTPHSAPSPTTSPLPSGTCPSSTPSSSTTPRSNCTSPKTPPP
ncbi:LysM peptidoglycan-binding domain-containing protein [Streptomyces sp. MT29]|nr:LysM peptidoglycan-binding domain-containing protein [Streptomyces sp. MT29]